MTDTAIEDFDLDIMFAKIEILTELVKLDKEYIAEVRIGESRSTGDLEGEVLEVKIVKGLTQDMVETALTTIVGTLTLPVSAYSAIKIDGLEMYKRARKAEKSGEVVTEVPIREMRVDAAELLQFKICDNQAVAAVRFSVGSGTYIRSLAEELGRLLEYPATLQALRRTKVGEFSIEDALTFDELAK